MICAHKSSHILYLYYRLTGLTGAFKIILIYGISLEGYQIICVRSFSFGPASFRKYKQVNIQQFRIHSTPKRTSADITLNIYRYNYQTETAIFLATKHEKTVMACSHLFFKYFLHFKLLTSNHAREIYVLNIEENYLTRQLS